MGDPDPISPNCGSARVAIELSHGMTQATKLVCTEEVSDKPRNADEFGRLINRHIVTLPGVYSLMYH